MRDLTPYMTVLGGRFRLTRLLGEGGMGVVWEATHTDGRRVAIKFLSDTSPELQKRFLREAEAVNAVRHPFIVRIHELGRDDDGTPAFVMDLLEGEPLALRLEREERLPLGQAAAILVPAIDALRAAHLAGVVHRDLKPENIFITREPGGQAGVRVLDFGIARLTRPGEKLTVTGTLMGTPLYMSPEQASGEAVDARTDVWSMAALAFECLTGTTLVSGENYGQVLARLIRRDIRRLADLRTDLPPDVVRTIDAHLVDRAQRPGDLASLAEMFARHADPVVHLPPAHSLATPGVRQAGESEETMLDASTLVRTPTRLTPLVIATAALVVAIATGAGSYRLFTRSTPTSATQVAPPAVTADLPPPPDPALPVSVASAPPALPLSVPPAPSASASARRVTGKAVPRRLSGGVADAPGY